MSLSRENEVPCAHATKGNPNSKRLVICCDGTWNNSNDGDSPATNVSRLSGAVAHKCCSGMPQIVYYHPGAGTESSWVAKKLGGLLGLGVVQDIIETYRFVCDNYNPGDEIILMGFSRGAFTARSVADMICNLGFLNRAGLDHLAEIFHDYSTWEDWKNEGKELDTSKHLLGFSLQNYDQTERKKTAWNEQEKANLANGVTQNGSQNGSATAYKSSHRPRKTFKESREAHGKLSPEAYAEQFESKAHKDLHEKKQALWEKIRTAGEAGNRAEISRLYREELAEQRLSMTQKTHPNGRNKPAVFEPYPGEVKAVAVWDTVGSLGIPTTPWRAIAGGRSNDEIRFASLEMHANVKYAFHALALDEYRTAFSPTMWSLPSGSKTILRQVWFAGNHGDVGGGWDDEQSANISLAWMADQLTSVGVEFSRPEMQRVFYDVAPTSVPERWAMGDIHDPPLLTSATDVAWKGIRRKEPAPRRPGLYVQDAAAAGTFAKAAAIVKGWFVTDEGVLLSGTEERVHPSVRIRYQCGGKGPDGEPTYRCRALFGNGYTLEEREEKLEPREGLTPAELSPEYSVVGGAVAAYRNDDDTLSTLGKGTSVVRVQQPFEECDVVRLPEAKRGWVWRRPAVGKETKPFFDLEEEPVGVWERVYMKVQEELVEWQPMYVVRQRKLAEAEAAKKWAMKRAADAVTSGIGGVLSAGLGPVGRWWVGKNAAARSPLLWGYHDLVVWMTGDRKGMMK
ncbi:peptidoglycan binding domain-containing protein [Plectosphaerella plurivora]|uniref:Peptidoglycan binding domain-containing protein n=1 Tax=Plectosphaerella plurivora TaxID=936078 RepID=A0A9P9A3J4_9PEZI|nr:peptidoglycan binding domain-containing protein [Plectosphaerella plurivora]